MNRRATMTLWAGTTPAAVDPVLPATTVIHPIPTIQNSAQNPNILHPLQALMLASLCIFCTGEQASRQLWRHGGTVRPDEAESIETALAVPLWQELTEDDFFQMLDNASVIDRRFGEYDWHFLSKVVVSDTMNADEIHPAGAKALAEWAEENLGPLSTPFSG